MAWISIWDPKVSALDEVRQGDLVQWSLGGPNPEVVNPLRGHALVRGRWDISCQDRGLASCASCMKGPSDVLVSSDDV